MTRCLDMEDKNFITFMVLSIMLIFLWMMFFQPVTGDDPIESGKLPLWKTLLFLGDTFVTLTGGNGLLAMIVVCIIIMGFLLDHTRWWHIRIYPFPPT